MTKLELEAIRTLPPRFVADGTSICEVCNMEPRKVVVAIHPMHVPIFYADKKRGWRKLKLSHTANTSPAVVRFP